jgi:phospholipid/cholesterol/gamma-HCH transport system permease protein
LLDRPGRPGHKDVMAAVADSAGDGFELRQEGGRKVLALRGRVDTPVAARLWERMMAESRGGADIDLAGVTALDTTGATLLLRAEAEGGGAIRNATEPVAAVLERVRAALAAPRPKPEAGLPALARLGQATIGAGRNALDAVAFLGEVIVTGLLTMLRPARLRWRELTRHLDEAGTRAFPLAVLLGVLLGVILAFQSAIPLRRFGAEIFVPNLVGISLMRELGPLMAGVILAGRTGSAYAAELGTMTVNEEVAALRIMGIDPMALLVLPRVLAGMLVMPVISLLLTLAGLAGMAAIMGLLGFPLQTVLQQLRSFVSLSDLLGGLFKALIFGLAIASIGCRAGLGAGRGPRAVGDAATAAVVGGIVSIVVLDGAFAVLYERLGL